MKVIVLVILLFSTQLQGQSLDSLKSLASVNQNEPTALYDIYAQICKIYLSSGELELACEFAEKCLDISKSQDNVSFIVESSELLYQLNYDLENYKEAYKYLELSQKYETDQDISNEEIFSDINEILIENQQLQGAQISYQYWLIGAILIFFITCMILVLLLRKRNNLHKGTNKSLKEKNSFIEEQKENLRVAYEELKKANVELKLTHSHLIQAEKMASLGHLTAGLAHEINNPVNFISSGINGLDKNLSRFISIKKGQDKIIYENDLKNVEGDDSEELIDDMNSLMGSIKEGAERSIEIIDGLRVFSHSDNQGSSIVDIHLGLDSTLMILNHRIKNRVKLIKNYDPELSKIHGFPSKLNQVFMNIITNSLDALKNDEGEIQISTANLPETIQIVIKDNGSGVPKDVVDQIFNPFFTTKEVGKGTGLGLWISFTIINEHHGSIELDQSDGYTSFVITLPK